MQRPAGLLIIAVTVIMLALAGNSIWRNAPLDNTWSLFLGGVITAVLGVPEVLARRKEQSPPEGDKE
ncbi:hypothetical protein [Deinococcus actinosclerus]|uniref:DUF3188 domain-containing protein n=1 Tax=Deinococcus actinosclerus TaxID=1768108 RepID=A0ABN4K4Z2_9DEIO|nr:hypothetical protein [Deinococcus actinosclerus]ALW89179.1 hypothetical protein AUC44_09955 [Deinococcus actinosclerus]